MPEAPAPSAKSMHSVTLRFLDEERERAYRQVSIESLRAQARLAVSLGIALYVLVGVLDPWFIPPADRASAWRWSDLTRIQAQLGPSHLLAISYLHNRTHYGHVGLDLAGDRPWRPGR